MRLVFETPRISSLFCIESFSRFVIRNLSLHYKTSPLKVTKMFTRLAFDSMDKLPVKLSSDARRWRLLNAWTNVARKSALVPSNVTPDAVLSLRTRVSRITVNMMNVMTINYSGYRQ